MDNEVSIKADYVVESIARSADKLHALRFGSPPDTIHSQNPFRLINRKGLKRGDINAILA